MRSNSNRKQQPLFYIKQPVMDSPRPVMQESFIWKYDAQETYGETESGTVPVKTANEKNETETGTNTQKEHAESEAEPESTLKKQTFNDLGLEEKIKHLMLVPSSVAKVRYEFITLERSYKGYFLAMKEGALEINSTSPRKKNVHIPEQELVDIKRIGL